MSIIARNENYQTRKNYYHAITTIINLKKSKCQLVCFMK